MDKIKRYIECYIPTETCNLRCHYCYILQKRLFNNKIAKFPYTAEHIKKALSVERLGGVCLLNFCAAGETMLADIIPIVYALLTEGHYIMLVTNGLISKNIDKVCQLPPNLLKHLIFKFSFHYLELKRLNKFETFFDNIHKVKKASCSYTVEITPNDELVPYIEEIKDICIDKLQTLCHITIARADTDKRIPVLSNYSFDEYKKIWGQFDSTLFEFKTTIFYKKRREFCYAGDWSCWLNLATGDLKQCYSESFLQNIYRHVEEPIHFVPVGKKCSIAHCFNGHAFLSLGVIPELDAPTYCDVRNRVTPRGEEWLNGEMKFFITGKLMDNNIAYTTKQKRWVYIENILLDIRDKVKKIKQLLFKWERHD